jgi:PAS domain S-box-containing protein
MFRTTASNSNFAYTPVHPLEPPSRVPEAIVHRVALACAFASASIATFALFGWIFDLKEFRAFLVTGTEMKVNTAIGLLMCSIGLALASWEPSVFRRRVLRFCAGFAGGLGFLTALEHLSGWDLRIDEALFRDLSALGTAVPGRMSVPTTICLMCFGAALLLIDFRAARFQHEAAHDWRWRRFPAPWLAALATLVPLQVLIGYFYGNLTPYGLGSVLGYMAPPTALALVLLGAGIVAARPKRGFMRHVLAGTPVGSFLRRFLFVLFVVAPLMGWIVLNLFGGKERPASYNVSMVVTISILLFAFLAWWFARALQRSEEAVRARAREASTHLKELQALLDAMPNPVWIAHDAECRVVTGNPASYQFLGAAAGDNISVHAADGNGKPAFRLRMRGNAAGPEELPLERAAATGRPQRNTEVEFLFPDGRSSFLLGDAVPLFDDAGAVRGAVGCFVDITARKEIEAALLESEKRFRQLADAMPQIVWAARPDGYLDYYNERWYEFTGFPRDSFGDQSWEPVLHSEDVQRGYATWYGAVQNGVPYQIEYRFKDRRTGEYRWHLGRAMPVRDEQGRIVRWFGTCTDIHDLKEAQEALAQHKVRLELAVADRTGALRDTIQQLETFSYSVVHDMRAPLRTMRSFAAFLQSDYGPKLDDTARDYIRRISNGANRLDTLIQDVLNYSRASKGEASLEPVSLDRVVEDIIREYPDIYSQRMSIQVAEPLPVVLGNTALLTQCVSNLIGNALKFVPKDRPPRVVVRAERNGVTAKLWVDDNGIGIPAAQHTRIFELFQRLHSQAEYPGTGVGLAIVRRAVERMNGSVGLESEMGQGSRFWIQLPVVGANEPQPLSSS